MGEIASEREVQNYMLALQKEMELTDQEQFGKQESAQSNYIVNMKNEQEFDVKEQVEEVENIHQIEAKDKGNLIHHDVEGELDLELDERFDLGEEMEDPDQGEFEQFEGHQDEEVKDDYSMVEDQAKELVFPRTEEIDTNLCTVYADKICEYLMEYAQINEFKVFFDVSDMTLNFNIPSEEGVKYFGMKFEFESADDGPTHTAESRNNYRIYFLKDDNLDEEEFKNMGLSILDQIKDYL